MSEMAESAAEPDGFCALCGAGEDTGEKFVSGFLAVPIVTERGRVSIRRICNACLSMVLGTVFQAVGHHGGGELANLVIEAAREMGMGGELPS